MPCRSDYMEPTHQERQHSKELTADLRTMADDLTYANDVLREYLLGEGVSAEQVLKFVNHQYAEAFKVLDKKASTAYAGVDGVLRSLVGSLVKDYVWLNGLVVESKPLSKAVRDKVVKQQEDHREADLRRLMRTFADAGDRVRLKKVLDADPTKPLQPQLGFDANEF